MATRSAHTDWSETTASAVTLLSSTTGQTGCMKRTASW